MNGCPLTGADSKTDLSGVAEVVGLSLSRLTADNGRVQRSLNLSLIEQSINRSKESIMRKVLLSAIVAASTLTIAAPAAAQLTVTFGNQYGYGNQYGSPYGNAYGYNNNVGQVRALMVRLNHIERQINLLDRRNVLSNREANRLRLQADRIQRQLRAASYNGLNGYEARDIYLRIARLEQNVRYQANDGNAYANRSYGSYGNVYDRDRDGRDDRYEDDRGYDHD